MKGKSIFSKLVIASFFALLILPSHGYAQSPQIQAPVEVSQEIEFSRLGLAADTILQGSFEEVKLVFSLPTAWELKPGAVINLNITNYFADLMVGQTDAIPGKIIVGELSVWLNGSKFGSLFLQDSGDFNYSINLDERIFRDRALAGLNELILRWDASVSCDYGIASTVTIQPTSKLILQYQVTALLPDLNQFPSPFFQQKSVEPQKVILLIPDQPTEGELQAALVIAAGFGKFSKGKMSVDLVPFNQLGMNGNQSNHLIVVGNLNTLASLTIPNLSSSITSQINSMAASENDGVVVALNSPWKADSVVLVVTGKTETAIIKAGIAVSSGALVASSEKNIALVKEISQEVPQTEEIVDITFSELDQQTIEISTYGRHQLEIPFTIPKSELLSPEAYLDLIINHSKLIDYNQSGLWVSLNGIPIGSVRFSDQTSETTLVRFIIPPSAIKSVYNKIEIETNLVSRNTCSNPDVTDHWITIFGDSTLHIPTIQESSKLAAPASIGDYPQPYLLDKGLSSTTIVVENDDLPSWKIASALVFNLGAETQSDNYLFNVRFPNGLNLGSSQDQQFLMVGLTNKIPFSTRINDLLPVPFNIDGGLRADSKVAITYEVKIDQPLGYLEMVALSISPQSEALLVLGSNAEGLAKAGQVLLDAAMREQMLHSNFVLIQEEKLHPEFIETRAIPDAKNGSNEPIKSPQSGLANLNRWTWIGLVGILVVLVLLIGTSIVKTLRDKKNRKKQIRAYSKKQEPAVIKRSKK
jgi:hypothetical protein